MDLSPIQEIVFQIRLEDFVGFEVSNKDQDIANVDSKANLGFKDRIMRLYRKFYFFLYPEHSEPASKIQHNDDHSKMEDDIDIVTYLGETEYDEAEYQDDIDTHFDSNLDFDLWVDFVNDIHYQVDYLDHIDHI